MGNVGKLYVRQFLTFNSHLLYMYFIAIWYILLSFGIGISPVLVCCTTKNLATLISTCIFCGKRWGKVKATYVFLQKIPKLTHSPNWIRTRDYLIQQQDRFEKKKGHKSYKFLLLTPG
jgi:hypothetical protein